MSKKDKESLILIAFFVAIILEVLVVSAGIKIIKPLYLGIFIVLVEIFFFIPRTARMYYRVMGEKLGMEAYIPIFNEIIMYPPTLARVSLVIWVITFLLIGCSFISNDVYASIFGMHFGLNSTFRILQIAILVFLVQCVVRAIAMGKVSFSVYRKYGQYREYSLNKNFSKCMQCILFFIPVVRVLAFSMLYNDLFVLTNFNNVEAKKEKKLKEEK